MKNLLSIYIHYPFCLSKCPYCDFNSHVSKEINHQDFLRAYEIELENFCKKVGVRKIKTIFFGGGTPSLMPLELVAGILAKINNLWQIDESCEISMEANPTSFEAQKFQDLRKIGINRLSLGIQALNDEDLKFLGRNHTAKESLQTIEIAAKIFDNFSFDLIYARPKQSLESWQKELETAISFNTKHLSLYQLTIEKGTQFFSDFKNKKFTIPDEEKAAQFYELTENITASAGFKSYEISNYAKENYECAHNLTYWRGLDYIGVGAGAHSRIYFKNCKNRQAINMQCAPKAWLESVFKNAWGVQKITEIQKEELLEELILMALRLQEGLREELIFWHFQKNFNEIFLMEKLQKLQKQQLILIDKGSIKIAPQKRILSDAIIAKVISCLQIY